MLAYTGPAALFAFVAPPSMDAYTGPAALFAYAALPSMGAFTRPACLSFFVGNREWSSSIERHRRCVDVEGVAAFYVTGQVYSSWVYLAGVRKTAKVHQRLVCAALQRCGGQQRQRRVAPLVLAERWPRLVGQVRPPPPFYIDARDTNRSWVTRVRHCESRRIAAGGVGGHALFPKRTVFV